MWHVIADLLREQGQALVYLLHLERTQLPIQSTAELPLRAAVLEPILARWPNSSE